jgi:hypothetical protein
MICVVKKENITKKEKQLKKNMDFCQVKEGKFH